LRSDRLLQRYLNPFIRHLQRSTTIGNVLEEQHRGKYANDGDRQGNDQRALRLLSFNVDLFWQVWIVAIHRHGAPSHI